MLFDLQGRRKRLIRVIYVLLAVSFLGGFLFFGVGTGGNSLFDSGSFLDVLGGGGGSGSGGQIKKYEKRVSQNPNDQKSYEQLITIQFQIARSPKNYNQQTGQPTKDGVKELSKLAQYYESYLKTRPKPKRVPTAVALAAVQSYVGLGRFGKAADAQSGVVDSKPTSNNFYQLALLAYQAGQSRRGDLAGQQAVARAPKSHRKQVKKQLAQVKKQVLAQQVTQGQQSGQPGQAPAQQAPQ